MYTGCGNFVSYVRVAASAGVSGIASCNASRSSYNGCVRVFVREGGDDLFYDIATNFAHLVLETVFFFGSFFIDDPVTGIIWEGFIGNGKVKMLSDDWRKFIETGEIECLED